MWHGDDNLPVPRCRGFGPEVGFGFDLSESLEVRISRTHLGVKAAILSESIQTFPSRVLLLTKDKFVLLSFKPLSMMHTAQLWRCAMSVDPSLVKTRVGTPDSALDKDARVPTYRLHRHVNTVKVQRNNNFYVANYLFLSPTARRDYPRCRNTCSASRNAPSSYDVVVALALQ